MAKDERGIIERALLRQGHVMAGVDEVGRGCVAGPVHAAAVILDYTKVAKLPTKQRDLLRDSKELTAKRRMEALSVVYDVAQSVSCHSASVEEIERLGIVGATFVAMQRSLDELSVKYSMVLVDGKLLIPNCKIEQRAIIKGDRVCYSIAAASIVAKVTRDQLMTELSKTYPTYGFERHVGYPTKAHLEAVASVGVTPIHRRNFAPIRKQMQSNPQIPS